MKVKQGEKRGKKATKDISPVESEDEVEAHSVKDAGIKKPKTSKATTFSSYISKVKKQIHPDLKISKSSMKIIDSFIEDFFSRICKESSNLMMSLGNKSLRAEDVIAATNLVIPGELGKHAVGEAKIALQAFSKKEGEEASS
jgi:histone H2B